MPANSKGRARPSQERPALTDHDDHYSGRADHGAGPLFVFPGELTKTNRGSHSLGSFSQLNKNRADVCGVSPVQTSEQVFAQANKPKRPSQAQRILAFLSQPHRPRLNQVQATAMGFGVRLPARIDELRDAGHDIRDDETLPGPMNNYYLAGE